VPIPIRGTFSQQAADLLQVVSSCIIVRIQCYANEFCKTCARLAELLGRRMGGSAIKFRIIQLAQEPPCPHSSASNLTARLPVMLQFSPILQFRLFRRFGVIFRQKPNLCRCTLAVVETMPKPCVGQFRRINRNRNRNRISVRLYTSDVNKHVGLHVHS